MNSDLLYIIYMLGKRGVTVNDTIYIGRKQLLEGWIKLNNDSACKDMGHIFGCGDLFVIHMVNGLKDTLRRLKLVMSYMLRYGGCIWVYTWLGESMLIIL